MNRVATQRKWKEKGETTKRGSHSGTPSKGVFAIDFFRALLQEAKKKAERKKVEERNPRRYSARNREGRGAQTSFNA